MESKKTKWLTYTVLVGFIPIFARLFAWLVTKGSYIDLFSSSDFVALGLVLHISNINEIEHFSGLEQQWKTIQNGISIVFIAFYSVLLTLNLLGESIVDARIMTYCAVGLATVSLAISYSVYDKISKVSQHFNKELT